MEKSEKYIAVLVIVVILMGFYFQFKKEVLLWISFGIGLISILSFYVAGLIALVWEKITMVIGTINSKILLTTIFYVFLVPIALISRLFKKKDELMLKRREGSSYYKEQNRLYKAEDLENVF